jgi:Icc-related predicted phosphoesterase
MNIAAIGDLHAKEHQTGEFAPLFASVCQQADILILCGDLTDTGHASDAHALAHDLSACKIPILAILGNHDYEKDEQNLIRTVLKGAGVHFIDEKPYHQDGVAFVGVKGFAGGFGRFTVPSFGETAMKKFVEETVNEAIHLGALLDSIESGKIIVALHYSPIQATIAGEPPEIHAFLGSSRLEETIERFPVHAVFHGHAHHGTMEGHTQAGIPVFNVARHVLNAQGQDFYLLTV